MDTEKSSQIGIVVSHSHWDRAWYLPFASFRHRLVKMIDRIIDLLESDQNYKSFTLDGQTVLIEDYLEIRPHKKEKLKHFISSGRLRIGPWYILPDLFLVSGESVIRNLQLADQIGKEFGALDKVGYVPDPFGHFSQLPQLLRLFGIDTFVFMRGMPKSEAHRLRSIFDWVAPDQSTVLAYYLREGYFNLSALGHSFSIGRFDLITPDAQKALEQATSAIQALKQHQDESVFLLLNGMDHMPEQKELSTLISHINQNQSDFELIHAGLPTFFDQLKAQNSENETFSGDLLGNAHHPILSSVWSTRVYLKQQNHKAQSNLEKYIEPLSVLNFVLNSKDHDKEFIDHAWKTLLKNHPHDDICGCSVDEVHRENEVFFTYVHTLCDQFQTELLEGFTSKGFEELHIEASYFADVFVYNPHPVTTSQTVRTKIFFENPEGEFGPSPEALEIKLADSSGALISVTMLDSFDKAVQTNYLNNVWGRFYKIEFEACAPAFGYQVYRAYSTSNPLIVHQSKQSSFIENNRYKIEVKGSTVLLTDSETGKSFTNPFYFESTRDGGDTYSYGPVKNDKAFLSTCNGIISSDFLRKELTLSYSLPVFESLNSENIQSISIELTISLRDFNSIDTKISYTNIAKDCRVRFFMNSDTQAKETLSDAHFRLAKRELKVQKQVEEDLEWYNSYPGEFEYAEQHQLDFSILSDSTSTFWSSNKGLHEFQLIELENSTWYAITLHRSVAWLSVGNSRIRRPQAGPQIATPEAQCLRNLSFSIQFGFEKTLQKELLTRLKSYSHPLLVKQVPKLDQMPKSGPLPRVFSTLSWDNPMIQVSALKSTREKGVVALRVVNLDSVSQQLDLQLGFEAKEYQFSDLYEQWNDLSSKKINSNLLKCTIEPYKIATLLLKIQN